MQNKAETQVEARVEPDRHRVHLCVTACVNAVLVLLAVAAILAGIGGGWSVLIISGTLLAVLVNSTLSWADDGKDEQFRRFSRWFY